MSTLRADHLIVVDPGIVNPQGVLGLKEFATYFTVVSLGRDVEGLHVVSSRGPVPDTLPAHRTRVPGLCFLNKHLQPSVRLERARP